ncbi:ABC transporter permease [Paenibacillus thalictri]|uniref:ABC transporter permease n=1 Tax=Paenibacillus thalictri TaxID=2527873 RepID=A0A4Q9DVM8_9BACL|nr:ABC transporter permease [Paenibacillus thalictri]TBL81104.1 ABC transporter permease [Paenibacillus thalictri]
MNTWHIALREVKIGFRNPWAYSFMALFTLFSLSLQLINAQNFTSGYSSATSNMLNLILYLLPLMTLLIGSFSLTSEKEEGSWQLLSTYPVSTLSYITGKYAGLTAVLLTVISFGYGISSLIGIAAGSSLELNTFVMIFVFSGGLVLLFLAIALWIGTVAGNRWQALTYGVAVWFFAIIGWPTLFIAFLGLLPYLWVKPVLVAFTLCNPAELVRLFVVVKLGGGSALGPEYYEWIKWIGSSSGTWGFIAICLLWIGAAVGFARWSWERGRYRG